MVELSSLNPLLQRQLLQRFSAEAGMLPSANLTQLAPVVALSAFMVLLIYVLGVWLIHLLWLESYRRHLHRHVAQWLRTYAPLSTHGVVLQVVSVGESGHQRSTARLVRLSDLVRERRLVLLTGTEASGKTVALHQLAFELTRRRKLLSLWMGQTLLPVLISVDYSPDATANAKDTIPEHMRDSLRRYGTRRLSARMPVLLARGRLALLCDGLDDVPRAQRLRTLQECAQLAKKRRPCAVITVCGTISDGDNSYQGWQQVALEPLSSSMVSETLTKLGGRRSADNTAHELPAPSLTSPAALAALIRLGPSSVASIYGRASLLRALADHTFPPAESSGDIRDDIRLIAAVAAGLRGTRQHSIPTAAAASLGRTLAEWLEQANPAMPVEISHDEAIMFSPEALQLASQRALDAGVLLRDSTMRHLRFANRLLEAAFAARWLDATDDGLGRLQPELVQPEWTLPMLLWAGAAEHPGDVTFRLLRLLDTPESASIRAGYTSPVAYQAAVLALALGTACESYAPLLAHQSGESREHTSPPHPAALVDEQLRDLLDRMFRHLDSPDQQDAMRAALSAMVEMGGREVLLCLRYLATCPQIQRLVRAQLVVVLGLFATEEALGVLVSLLDDPDELTRQAVARALTLAGARALPSLHRALSHPSQRVRVRAAEALTQFGDAAIDTAIAGLGGQQPEQRAAAAQTLGTLNAAEGEDPLLDHLAHDSSDAVRAAAALALGRIATSQAIAALEHEAGTESPTVRAAVAHALGIARQTSSFSALLTLLADSDPRVRTAAATALGLLGDERAVPSLQEHRDDQDPWTQNAVVLSLRRLGS